MEDNKTGSSSDRDKKMMGSFESYADKVESNKKKKKAKEGLPKLPPLFESPSESAKVEAKDDPFAFLRPAEKPEKTEKSVEPEQAEAQEDLGQAPEELADDEVQMVVEQYVDARTEQLKEELTQVETDSPEEAGILADVALLETIRDKADQQEVIDEAVLDESLAETVDDLGLEEAMEDALEDTLEDDEDDPALAATSSATNPPPVPPIPPRPPVIPPTPPTLPIPPIPPIPPLPPIPPIPPGPPLNPNLPTPGPNVLPPSPNVQASNPNTAPDRHNRGGDILLGGVLGYLLGRRRGRIKTEERLLPVQEKLEEKVRDLHSKVAEREDKIRALAAEKAKAQPEKLQPLLIQRLEARQQRKEALPKPALVELPPVDATREAAPAFQRPIIETGESSQRVEGQAERPPERLGRFLVPRAEVARPATPENIAERDISNLTIPELLSVAARIERSGATVKEMYEGQRLDALGLRRVVTEYLRGRSIERILTENLKQLETMERLPQADPGSLAAQQAASGQAVGDAIHGGAPASPIAPPYAAQPNFMNSAANLPTSPPSATGYTPHKARSQNQVAMLVGFATAAVILVILAFAL